MRRALSLALLAIALALPGTSGAQAGELTIAAAADLKFAMDRIVRDFRARHAGDTVQVVYGSSGNFHAQLRAGAPYDLFFSADINYPRELAQAGLAAGEVTPYATGRIVLWSARRDAGRLSLAALADPTLGRIAIANPKHAPYGKRAEEALRASGLWQAIEPRLVYGENIAQTAQFVETGNAEVGIIALSLAASPPLAAKGGYFLIPDTLHAPLEQGFIITRRAAANPLARQFAAYVQDAPARAVLRRYGFVLPGDPAAP